jgi:hypothetical protein
MTIDLAQQLRAAQARHVSDPLNIAILQEICALLTALKREEEMLPWADRALAIDPRDAATMTRRAVALYLLGRYAEAADAWTRDHGQQGRPALQRLRLGMTWMMAGDLVRATPLLEEAWQMAASGDLELVASVGFALGEALLKNADPRGFAYWLMRNDVPSGSPSYRPLDIPPWSGESDLRGKRILVTHALGFGDNFLLASRIADWLDAGASVMFTCSPQSHTLIQASLPRCEVISAPSPARLHAPLPDELRTHADRFAPHLHATLLHLPLLKARQAATSGPWFAPYLKPSPHKRRVATAWGRQLRAQCPGKRLAGLFWDCAQRHWPESGAVVRCWAQRRSLPLDAVNQIVQQPRVADCVHFVNLHHPAVAALAGTPVDNVSSYLPGIRDFDDTAACITQLDAVVAVDSSVANLAVMLGVPTCVPTHSSGDWRWGLRDMKSPWIENVTTLRQVHEGDWSTVVPRIQAWLLRDLPAILSVSPVRQGREWPSV